jgi:hypothetical protein
MFILDTKKGLELSRLLSKARKIVKRKEYTKVISRREIKKNKNQLIENKQSIERN